MPKESYTFKLDSELLKSLKQKAKTENRSFNNFVETELKKSIPKS
jgi:predicted HicB family RNase H-like nuclease|tara:strand:- start:21 stop:155 length:135 start_codon:yes stop_codon:yes gene_type:complete